MRVLELTGRKTEEVFWASGFLHGQGLLVTFKKFFWAEDAPGSKAQNSKL